MPLFEDANKAVVEAAYDKLDIAQTATAAAVAQSAPTLASDGVPLLNSSRCILVVKPGVGATCDASVYGYTTDTGWFLITELGKTGIAGGAGDGWKANIGGPSRISLIVTNIAGGTVDAWVLRSYV
jgi:hypothetical protein